MPRVTVIFSDSEKMDKAGNPVVEIETESTPKFPEEGEDKFSPAQKSAIVFLSRGGQPEVKSFLQTVANSAKELSAKLDSLRTEETILPLDLEICRLEASAIMATLEEKVNTFA